MRDPHWYAPVYAVLSTPRSTRAQFVVNRVIGDPLVVPAPEDTVGDPSVRRHAPEAARREVGAPGAPTVTAFQGADIGATSRLVHSRDGGGIDVPARELREEPTLVVGCVTSNDTAPGIATTSYW